MKIAILAIAIILAGCGSSKPPPIPIPPPQTLRNDLLFGYFGDIPAETLSHTNLTFVLNWDSQEKNIQDMMLGQAQGNCVMVDMAPQLYPLPFNPVTALANVRNRFQALKDVDVLKSVCALYGIDEPKLHGLSSSDIEAMNGVLRSVADEFHMDVKVVNVHATQFDLADVASADVVGFDHYSVDIFSNGEYARLKSLLTPTQKIILVPGAKDDINRFFNVAETDRQVWAVVPFSWRTFEGIQGIRNNSAAFRQVGQKISRP